MSKKTNKENQAELTTKAAKKLVGKVGELVLKDGKVLKGATILEANKTIVLNVRDGNNVEYPVPLDKLQSFREYGTVWLSSEDKKTETDEENGA